MVAFPGAFVEGHAGFQHQGCVAGHAAGLGRGLEQHTVGGLVKFADDESGNLVAGMAHAVLGKYRGIVGHGGGDQGHVAELAQQPEIFPGAEEVSLAEIVVDQRVVAADVGAVVVDLVDEEVDFAQVAEIPFAVLDLDCAFVAEVEQFRRSAGLALVVADVVVGIQACVVGPVERQERIELVGGDLQVVGCAVVGVFVAEVKRFAFQEVVAGT